MEWPYQQIKIVVRLNEASIKWKQDWSVPTALQEGTETKSGIFFSLKTSHFFAAKTSVSLKCFNEGKPFKNTFINLSTSQYNDLDNKDL